MTSEAGGPDAGPSRPKVFISYSRRDMVFADQLEAALKSRGFEPLIDRSEIYAFEEWWARIEALIARADTVVFALSPDSVGSDVALKEVAFAASLNKRFAPVVCRRVDDKAVPQALARLNFVFFEDEGRFEENADRLAEALGTDIGWIRQHTEFGEAGRRWALVQEPNGLLLRSPVLEQAERWIAARPRGAPAPTEQTQTFIRRSRQAATRRRNVLTGSLAAGLVLALALASLAYWQRGIAVEQRAVAQTNEALAKDERDKAERNFKLAQETAESLVFDIAQGLRNVEGMRAEAVRRILDTAKTTFEQLAASAPGDLTLQRSRAVMLNEFGDTYLTLGDVDRALEAFRDGLAIAQRIAAADPANIQGQRDVLVSYAKIGAALVKQGKLNEALKAYRDGLAIAERLAGNGVPSSQRDLSVAYNNIGDVLMAQGDFEGALKAYRDSLAIRERLAAADPATASGSAISRFRISSSATYWHRSASSMRRSRPTAQAQPFASGSSPGTAATRSGCAICRSRTTGSATCSGARASPATRSRPIATGWPSPNGWPYSTATTCSGSAILRSLTTRSVMCSWRWARLTTRSGPSATASRSRSAWRPRIAATASGSAICRSRMRRSAMCWAR